MKTVLLQYYPESKVIANENYIYASGDINVGLVSHADTVHYYLPDEVFIDKDKGVMWSPQGLGADDRAGLYAIINILKDGYRPTVIICNQEEVGGKGAQKLIADFPEPITKLNFLLELDRMGYDDMVFYDCDNIAFENYIGRYGFEKSWGTFSDISIIAPAWKIAAVNLSIGYEDEHSLVERLYFSCMLETIDKVEEILEAESVENHPFSYIPKKFPARKYIPIRHVEKKDKCDFCGTSLSADKTVYVEDWGLYQLCQTCADETTSICQCCGKRFFAQSENDSICTDCREDFRHECLM